MRGWRRREWLGSMAAAALVGCDRDAPKTYDGTWLGADHALGHRLREAKSGGWGEPAVQRRVAVLVVGAGIAGLAAARAFAKAGMDDCHVLDLEREPGGNSRGHTMAGMRCPLGAHYLPLPGDRATEVIALLEELGLRRTEHGAPVYDERYLCHSPQERLFIDGQWHDGLLPPIEALPAAQRAPTLAQYRRFAAAVARAGAEAEFSMPTARAAWSPALDALDQTPFAAWLDANGFDAPALRWYLDYCCRDDYGAGAARVSAWAGLHYFASRHGFHAPGEGSGEPDNVLTWPEGNAWLARRLAEPLAERMHTGRLAVRVDEGRHEVVVDAWDVSAQRLERWTAQKVVLAVPLFIAARLFSAPPPALTAAVAAMRYAPWLVANLHLREALRDHAGAAPSWDNMLYADPPSSALGYVDAMHQSLLPYAGPTVLTAYWAFGGASDAQAHADRARLLAEPWSAWSSRVVQSLAAAHPDLPAKIVRVDLMRYGHAMSIPLPGVRSSAALRTLADQRGRVRFAHSDLSGYSVFEEALYRGARVA